MCSGRPRQLLRGACCVFEAAQDAHARRGRPGWRSQTTQNTQHFPFSLSGVARRMKKQVLAVVAATVALAACDGFKEAMTAHVDVVARAGSQELSVTRLSDLLGNSKVPLRKDVAKAVADLWVNYQLLGAAAARGDSLNSVKAVDQAMWAAISNARAKKWYDIVSKNFGTGDASAAESRYA